MLVCTEGKERTLAEYRVLLERAGFTDVRGHFTGTPLDAIFAVKA
jgi:acetylserotonin N-methyltransferase